MSRRGIAFLALLVLLLALAWPADRLGGGWSRVFGLLVLAGVLLVLTLLPWGRWIPGLAPMPDLWRLPGPAERWCAVCGRPAPEGAACPGCRTLPDRPDATRKPASK